MAGKLIKCALFTPYHTHSTAIDAQLLGVSMEALECVHVCAYERERGLTDVSIRKQIAISFEKFDLISKNDCVNNFIDVYGNDTNVSNP